MASASPLEKLNELYQAKQLPMGWLVITDDGGKSYRGAFRCEKSVTTIAQLPEPHPSFDDKTILFINCEAALIDHKKHCGCDFTDQYLPVRDHLPTIQSMEDFVGVS